MNKTSFLFLNVFISTVYGTNQGPAGKHMANFKCRSSLNIYSFFHG